MFGFIGHCVVSVFVGIRQPVYMIIQETGLAMVFENVSKYPIGMKFSGYNLSLYADASAIDFGSDRSNR